LERWKQQNAEVLIYVASHRFAPWEETDIEDPDEDIVSEELLESVSRLNRNEYEVVEIIQESFLDLDQIVSFLDEVKKFKPSHDDKLQKLIRLLKSKDLEGQKVLIFTEFADTARYLFRQLTEAGIEGLDQVDSGTKGNRADILQRFSPYYNGIDSTRLREQRKEEIRVLISTDVLSEGLNLQDASLMMNYDIHWNPVRLMQRIGRVDRRLNPAIEEALVRDHPDVAASRGKVSFWNFLPPAELNLLLTLYTKVTEKTLMISRTLGIEGKKLLRPEDDFEALREFNHVYEGTKTPVEQMHLEYQSLLRDNPDLESRLNGLPSAFFSGRVRFNHGTPRGVFFCYALPALDKQTGEFTEEAGTTRWYLYDTDKNTIIEEPGEIIETLRCDPKTPRNCAMEEKTLKSILSIVLRHIKDSYLKRVDAPIGVKPMLKCWMEIN
jgi:hypothetical protein